MVAEMDGLRDHAFYLAWRILKLGGSAGISLMRDYMHGFCNMDTNFFGITECRQGTLQTTSLFRTLFLVIDSKQKVEDSQ